MTVHLHRDIEKLKKKVLALSATVEESVRDALAAFRGRDGAGAERIISGDIEIDRREIEVEEECLKILALHQPVAIDLRFLVSVLKINNDLERIGDLAVNIAERARSLASKKAAAAPPDFEADLADMAGTARSMLKRSLDALVNLDAPTAHGVFADDDIVDKTNRKILREAVQGISRDPSDLEGLMALISVSRHLERIGDLATNIAEDVIYMIEGRIVRHGGEESAS